MPDRAEMEEELISLMRQAGRRNHRSKQDQGKLLAAETAPQPNKNLVTIWPKYKGPVTQEQPILGRSKPFKQGKYSGAGPFTKADMTKMGINDQFAETFAKAMNGSRSRNTWKQRESVKRTVNECRMSTGMPLEFPWEDTDLQVFVGWCMEEELRSTTINQYVSNIRSLHREMGTVMAEESWRLMRQAIEGHGNLMETNVGRVPMTPELLWILKTRLSTSDIPIKEKRLVWTVCTALFQGSFRVGEILAATTTNFCPDSTLTGKDVILEEVSVGTRSTNLLKFRIKIPKETRGKKDVWVEVFDLGQQCFYNCTTAWKKWRESSTLSISPDRPVFRKEDGSNFTAQQLNGLLKKLLVKDVDYSGGFVATHSFRAGMASIMGKLGYSDEEIRRQGRWQSSSFLTYLKLGRAERVEQQYRLANGIAAHVAKSVNN